MWEIKAKHIYEKALVLLPGDKITSDVYGDIAAKTGKVKNVVFLKRIGIVALVVFLFLLVAVSGGGTEGRTNNGAYTSGKFTSGTNLLNLMLGKEKKDGFDEETNKIYSVGNIAFSIPSYYDDERLEESVIYLYAETGDVVVMLIACI